MTGSNDGTARVWDAKTGEEKVRIVYSGPVGSVAWNPQGTRIATASDDGTARIDLLDPAELEAAACRRVTRNMTHEEWSQFLGDEPYRETCQLTPRSLEPLKPAVD